MSKLAQRPIAVPDGVKISVDAGVVVIAGKLGTLRHPVPHGLGVEIKGKEVTVVRREESKQITISQGTLRSHLLNRVRGVSEGFKKILLLEGVGYRAAAGKNVVNLTLGFSHPVEYALPEGIKVETPEPTRVIVSGTDIDKVGQVAAELRRLKPPEPYKGKGFRYDTERIRRKAGKAAAK